MAFPLENILRNAGFRPTTLSRGLSRSQSNGSCWKRGLLAASALCALSALPLSAQQRSYGSSSAHALLAGEDIDGASMGSAPEPVASPQYGGASGGYSGYHESKWSHLAVEAGGGLTIPVGNDVNGGFTTIFGDTGKYGATTWGGNFLAGGGWSFSKKFTLMGEWQYNANKIPGKTLSAVYNSNPSLYASNNIASLGGNVHLNSITAEPIYYYSNSDKRKYTGYVIGGVGYYHQTINFTAPIQQQSYYGVYVQNANILSYGNNAWGVNAGTGVSYKILGPDSRLKIFAEVRYVFADTPRETRADTSNANILHVGTEEQIPISFGVRF